MIKKYILAGLVMLGAIAPAFGQQDPMYSQYMFNHLVLNPAYAGKEGYLSATLLARQQWVGIAGAPSTQNLTLHTPSANDRHGFGLSIYNDKIGVTSNTSIGASYAFRIHLGERARLCLGLNGNIMNYRANFDGVRTGSDINPNIGSDPSFDGNVVNIWVPNAGAGVFFHTRHFYAGVSAPRLIEQPLAPKGSSSDAVQARHFFATTGLVIGADDAAVKFRPSVLMKYQMATGPQFDINAHFLFIDKFWIGASFRTEDALVFMAEWNLKQWLRIGYAYDWTRSDISSLTSGSHEFMLGIDFNFKKSMISPRYF